MRKFTIRFGQAGLCTGVLAGLVVTPAFAHHPMGGMTPQTVWQGFASGIGHPVIGPDHFAFIVLAALVFAMTRASMSLSLTLIVSGLGGTLLRAMPIEIPFAESLVALTLVAAGAVALSMAFAAADRTASRMGTLVALAGVLHGFAWGESVVGADAAVIGSYLAGLAVVQFAVVAALVLAFRAVSERMPRARAAVMSFAGFAGMVAGAGFLVTA